VRNAVEFDHIWTSWNHLESIFGTQISTLRRARGGCENKAVAGIEALLDSLDSFSGREAGAMVRVSLDGFGRWWTAGDLARNARHAYTLDGLDGLDGAFFFKKEREL
jgi:hypothetical protein